MPGEESSQKDQLDESLVVTEWQCIKDVLSVCRTVGCGDLVLDDNMSISQNGK